MSSLDGGRRPARARKAVTHYSDDNPSTFTVKRKRNSTDGLVVADSRSKRRDKRASSSTLRRHSSSSLGSSGALRPPIPSSVKVTHLSKSPRRHSTDTSSNNNNNKRKRPPSTAASNHANALEAATAATEVTPEPVDEILAHRVTIQPVLRPKNAPTQHHHHRASKSSTTNRNPLQQLAERGRWNLPTPSPHFGWKLVPPAFEHHTLLSGTNGEPLQLPPPALTAVSAAQQASPYWWTANAAGHVVVYDTRHASRAVRTLETAASRRESTRTMTSKTVVSFPNMIHAMAASRRGRVVVWTERELQALDSKTGETLWQVDLEGAASQRTAVAAATQCLDWHATDAKLVWQKPPEISPVGPYEGACGDVSATLYLLDCTEITSGSSHNNGLVKFQALPPTGPDARSHAVTWDAQNPHCLLQVATTVVTDKNNNSDDVWELRRMTQRGEVLDRTTLQQGTSAIYTGCRIKQAADYLFLCTARGIRCFDAQRLTFLTVYGETVALHGKTVGWQDCFWLPEANWPHTVWQAAKPSTTSTAAGGISSGSSGKDLLSSVSAAMSGGVGSSSKTAPCLLSTQDELARRRAVAGGGPTTTPSATLSRANSGDTGSVTPPPASSPTASSTNLFSNMLLVGIPHPHRGPSELQSTLYVWKPGQVLPLTTLQAPPGGLLGVHMSANPVYGWQLTAATAATGQAHEWRAALQSDFPGNMYPTHYQVIDDNVEYLEDEDELDKGGAAPSFNGSMKDDVSAMAALTQDEEDLQRALRESLDEHGNVKIDVLNTDEDENANPDAAYVPAWPDASLRPRSSSFSKTSSSQPSSPSRFRKPEPELFAGFPQLAAVRQARQEMPAAPTASNNNGSAAPNLTEAERLAILNKATKGKRSRTANVEVLLQASIDPELKQEMAAAHRKWSTGQGSRLRPVRRTAEEKELALELLLLSPNSGTSTPTNPKSGDGGSKAVLPPPAATSGSIGTTTNGTRENLPGSSLLATTAAPAVGELKAPPEPPNIVSTSTVSSGPVSVPSESQATDRQQKPNGPAEVCFACLGRMVIHSCGKRAKPVDVEALERAEAERKAAEEAEKQRIKVEKRRAAEAKRREARKKKKEEEERKRREEELQKLEEERVAALQKVEEPKTSAYSSYTSSMDTHRKIPRYADLMSAPVTKRENEYSFGYAAAQPNGGSSSSNTSNNDNASSRPKDAYARQPSSGVGSEGSVYSSTSFTPAAVEPLFKPEETTPLDEPTYHRPSYQTASSSVTASAVSKPLSASDSDALAVLAGLADQQSSHEPPHYDYSGAEDRRRAILNQYHTSLTQPAEERSFSVYDRPASYMYSGSSSAAARETESKPAAPNGGGLLYYNHHKPKTDDTR